MSLAVRLNEMKRLRRYHYLVIGVALLVLIGIGWIVLQNFSTPSRVNAANFSKIKEGITEEEVYDILGKPWKPYFRDDPFTSGVAIWLTEMDDLPPWVPNNTQIAVYFDTNGRVVTKEIVDIKRSWKKRFAKYLP